LKNKKLKNMENKICQSCGMPLDRDSEKCGTKCR
jgi:hypothetical protein